ncbi:MAG: hypothetical protein KOO62_00760 [candidate division Zixibacteria bacterium]|nr:hypothetical protein [candidate division Zixibacteria bacterium]
MTGNSDLQSPAPELHNDTADGRDEISTLPFPSPIIDRTTSERAFEILNGLLHIGEEFLRTNSFFRFIITTLVRGLEEYFPELCDEIMEWLEYDARDRHYSLHHEGLQRVASLFPGAPLLAASITTEYRRVATPAAVVNDVYESGSHLKGYDSVY